MKTRLLFFITLFFATTMAYAYDVLTDGIFYNLDNENKTAEVTYWDYNYNSNSYSGSIIIPEYISYSGTTYQVTKIGEQAFVQCTSLSSITIPNSVTEIGGGAFAECTSLSSITIPKSVTYIGHSAFFNTPWLQNQPDGCLYINNSLYCYKGYVPANTNIVVKEGTTQICGGAFDSSNLTSISIPNSVTEIGKYAFSDCRSLTSIKIPDSVTEIEDQAFQDCYALSSVSIGNSVTKIGRQAFSCCSSLTSIAIPNSVTEIGEYAFSSCYSLTSIKIPNNVTEIKTRTFGGCSALTSISIGNSVIKIAQDAFDDCPKLTKIEVDSNNNNFTSVDGVLCNKDMTSLLKCPEAKTSVTIPNNVTEIGSSAFSSCTSLTSIKIPNSVTKIGSSAFSSCKSLTSIAIPNSVTEIGSSAFSYCSSLTSIKIPNGVISIGRNAFSSCSSLDTIICLGTTPPTVDLTLGVSRSTCVLLVPENAYTDYQEHGYWGEFLTIGTIEVDYKNIITEVNNAEWGSVDGEDYYNKGEIATLIATANDGYHFKQWSDGNTDNPRTIIVTQDAMFTAIFEPNTFNITTTVNNENIGTTTGSGEYLYGTEIELAAIPAEGYHFVKWSDGDTNARRTIKVTSNLTLTAEFAINVYTVTLTAQNGTVIGAGEYNHGTEVTLSATPNAGYHFVKWSDGNINVTRSIVVTSDVTLTAEFAINVYTVTLSAQNGTVTGASEYNHGQTAQITAIPSEGYHFVKWSDGDTNATRSIIVTSNVTLTAEFAINVYTVTLSAQNGTVIGAGQYEHGEEVTISATANEGYFFVKWLDGNTDNPRTIIITKDTTFTAEFENNIIASGTCGDNLIWQLTFDSVLTISGIGAMYDYTSSTQPWSSYRSTIKSVVIEDSVTSIGGWAFSYCASLTFITIPNSVTSIGGSAFSSCESLTSITLPNTVTSIGGFAFSGCESLTSITIPNSVTSIGEGAFSGCASLTSIIIPKSVTSIGDWAFSGCESLISIILPNSVTSIGEGAFRVCTSLTSITLPNSVTSIGDYTFYNCASLTSITLPNSVTSIGDGTFSYCRSLTSITLPNSVTSIGDYAFYNSESLTSMTLKATTPPIIKGSAFTNVSEMILVTVPCGSLEAYQSAEYWNEFSNFVESEFPFEVSVSVNDTIMGNAEITNQNCANNKVALTATPNEGYHFVKWSDGDTNATRLIIVTSNVTLTAEFAINVYTVTLSAQNGTVTGASEYNHGQTANITAIPAEGYHFVKWSDGDTNATRSIIVTSNVTLAAEFAINVYSVTLSAQNGTVTGASEYNHGQTVNITATPAEGYHFVKWSDGNTNATRSIIVTSNVTLTAEFAINVYTVTLSAQNGTVIGAGEYNHGTDVTLSATPNAGYHFVKWSDGNTNVTRSIVVTSNVTLTAEFAINVYTVTLSAQNGTVTGASEYNHGQTANITATPAEGYHFVKWSDGDTNATRSIIVTSNVTLTAEFAINVYTVTLSAQNGTVTGASEYNHGQTANITATPAEGYHFVKWSDGDTNATRSIVVTSNVTLTAEFAINVYTVTLSAQNGTVIGSGQYEHGKDITISATPNEGYHFVKWSDGDTNAARSIIVTSNVTITAEFAINVYTVTLSAQNGTVTGASEYNHGQTANITATPAEGYHFVKWSDGDTNATRSIIVTSNVTLTAEFAINIYTVTLSAQNGTVTGASEYNHGQTAQITAIPSEGYHFVKWSDGDTNATRSIIVTSNVTLTAEFAINIYTVTLSAQNGTVIGSGQYEHGKDITISATPNEGYRFVKWSDGNTNATRTIKVTSNLTLTAEFAINVYTVTLSAQNGTVTGSGQYEHGKEVTISATANESYHFVKWSDGDTNATRSIIVTSNVTLTAEFAINVYTVTLLAQNGTVTGAGQYEHGKEVMITAVANEGYRFVKWSDGDLNATRTIKVTSNLTFTAEFAINVYTVTLLAQNGTVTGAGQYEHGKEVSITATPNEGYHFVKWSDGDVNATRTIKITTDLTLTAEFAINVYTLILTAENGTVTGAGQYEHGKEVSITATPNEGYHFVKWSDGNVENPRTIVIIEDMILAAEFEQNVINTDLEDADVTNIKIYVQDNMLYLEGVEKNYYVFDASGRLVYSGRQSVLSLPRGVYIIAINGKIEKIVL